MISLERGPENPREVLASLAKPIRAALVNLADNAHTTFVAGVRQEARAGDQRIVANTLVQFRPWAFAL